MPYPQKFRTSLREHNIDQTIIAGIDDGYEGLTDNSPKKEKFKFFLRAMKTIDEKMDFDTKCVIIDDCACSKGGRRDKDIKRMAKEVKGKSLAEKVKALWEIPNMGKPVLNADGTITTGIYYQDGDLYKCACPCFHNERFEEAMSSTYCLCCAGHFRYHYQNGLGVKLKTKEVRSSPLESLGKDPCVFVFQILE